MCRSFSADAYSLLERGTGASAFFRFPSPLVSERFVVAASAPLSASTSVLVLLHCNGEGSTAYFLADGFTAIAKASV